MLSRAELKRRMQVHYGPGVRFSIDRTRLPYVRVMHMPDGKELRSPVWAGLWEQLKALEAEANKTKDSTSSAESGAV